MTTILQQNLILYGLSYFNLNLQLKPNAYYAINVAPLNFRFDYLNLIPEPVQIDFSEFLFNFTQSPNGKDSVLLLAAPVIQNWGYTFLYKLKAFGLSDRGVVRIAV
jgi:hypothetical protein